MSEKLVDEFGEGMSMRTVAALHLHDRLSALRARIAEAETLLRDARDGMDARGVCLLCIARIDAYFAKHAPQEETR